MSVRTTISPDSDGAVRTLGGGARRGSRHPMNAPTPDREARQISRAPYPGAQDGLSAHGLFRIGGVGQTTSGLPFGGHHRPDKLSSSQSSGVLGLFPLRALRLRAGERRIDRPRVLEPKRYELNDV